MNKDRNMFKPIFMKKDGAADSFGNANRIKELYDLIKIDNDENDNNLVGPDDCLAQLLNEICTSERDSNEEAMEQSENWAILEENC